MNILSDRKIKEYVDTHEMITPYEPTCIRRIDDRPVLSYGSSSFGYDIRLSSKEFLIFKNFDGHEVNPKNFSTLSLGKAELHTDDFGQYFVLPANSYGLGVAVEKLNMPKNVTGIAMGKSTYARCGIIANITPIEAGWEGHLTLEFSNSSKADCRIYANEGVIQILFLQGDECSVSYDARNGKYQNQSEEITLPKA